MHLLRIGLPILIFHCFFYCHGNASQLFKGVLSCLRGKRPSETQPSVTQPSVQVKAATDESVKVFRIGNTGESLFISHLETHQVSTLNVEALVCFMIKVPDLDTSLYNLEKISASLETSKRTVDLDIRSIRISNCVSPNSKLLIYRIMRYFTYYQPVSELKVNPARQFYPMFDIGKEDLSKDKEKKKRNGNHKYGVDILLTTFHPYRNSTHVLNFNPGTRIYEADREKVPRLFEPEMSMTLDEAFHTYDTRYTNYN